jgi:hypothetical protein
LSSNDDNRFGSSLASFLGAVCLDVEVPHHGDEVLVGEWNLSEALVNFKLGEFLVDSGCPLWLLHSVPEGLGDIWVLEYNREGEVLSRYSCEVDLIVGGETIEPVLSDREMALVDVSRCRGGRRSW